MVYCFPHYVSDVNLCLLVQVNARKVYDEANVLAGILSNRLFTAILLGEATLQVWTSLHVACR